MKKERNLFAMGAVLLAVFVVVAVFTFGQSNRLIQQGYLASEGSAAEDFAVLTASNIHLSNAQVERLKNSDYAQMQASPENEALRTMMSNDSFVNRVHYAYVMVHLPADEVKYSVNRENSATFEAPIGTPLDILWLLDVSILDTEEAPRVYSTEDVEHYAYYIDEDDRIFGSTPSYLLNESEWGDHICGYAPLYSTEGDYIGAVGVELKTHEYDGYRITAMLAMGLLLMVSTLTLMLLFTILYRNYSRLQFEKIYTDPLTRISNRSYYNDQFIKKLNNEHGHAPCFALFIADIDWFKKVNDTFGHEVGDEVLLELGAILLEQFGKSHVVRFGGEEFVVGLWVRDEAEMRTHLQTLFATIAARKFTRQQINLTLSLGCSLCCCSDLTGWRVSEMLKTADQELYHAKENGRNNYRMVRCSPTDNPRTDDSKD